MKVLVKHPQEWPHIEGVKNELNAIRDRLEAGTMEIAARRGGYVMLCDEDGKLKGLNPNIQLEDSFDVIAGTIIVCGADDEACDFIGIDSETDVAEAFPELFNLYKWDVNADFREGMRDAWERME